MSTLEGSQGCPFNFLFLQALANDRDGQRQLAGVARYSYLARLVSAPALRAQVDRGGADWGSALS